MIKQPLRLGNQNGLIMITIIVASSALLIIGLSLLSAAAAQYRVASNSPFTANALLVAEAGIEQSIQQLNADDNFSGYSSDQQLFDTASQGRGTYTTSITDSASDSTAKIITSTGKVYRHNQLSEPVSTRIVRVTVVGTSSESYSVHAGVGGLILGGVATILNSDVSVNGKITMTGAARIGSFIHPVNVNVAHQACPTGNNPGPTYPQVCTSGQPISLGWSTFIYGSVCATGQTSTGPSGLNIQGGINGEGLKPGCVAPPSTMPTYDRNAHIAAVTTTAAGNSNTYVCNSWPFNRTWTNNLRLTGNVDVDGICNVTLRGNVYITGDLDIGGAARITVDNSLGTTRPVIMVDGKITVNGAAQLVANSSGAGIDFYSFKSSASCGPNCTTITGNDLKTSSNLETISIGGAAILPGMIFDAYWGKITIGGIGNVGAAVGQTVDMSGAGSVTFGTSLASGSRTWTITSYQQKYPHQL